ncbi:SusC/RagA family TonB-linked outer membrane protein [Riemerella anatipestifer]|uniref:SusC/RagA family TonB-linked outer membrane protein n=1 Tax=Riemerella anatipestifer TaxID=34085 RepID=UPI0030C1FF2D
MNVKLRVLTAGAVFFIGAQTVVAQKAKKDSIKEIKEVVILGYGKTMSKSKSSTASTTVTSDLLENRPNASFLNSVQGTAPGVSINSSSGSPGSGKINVMVRGMGSLNASTDPLYVIDGLMSTGNEFRNLNPNDIETISILKDAQATAIYGNYGANGVLVITTKSGAYNSGLKVSYDAVTNFSTFPMHKYNLASSRELLTIQQRVGNGLGSTLTQSQIDGYAVNTDWNKEFFRVGMSQQHNLGLRYGAKLFTAYTSLGYLDSEGIIKSTDFKRFTLRSNINGKSENGRFSYSAQIGLGYSKRNQLDQETNSTITYNTIQNPLYGAVTAPTYLEPYRFTNGQEMYDAIGANWTGRGAWILSDIINGGIKNRFSQTSAVVNVSGSYKITDDLTIANKTGVNYKQDERIFARDPFGYLSVVVAKSQKAAHGGNESVSNTFDTTLNSVTSLLYDKKIGEHTLGLGAYIDYLRGFYASRYQYQPGLRQLDWVFGAGTGYVPFNPDTPALYRPSVSLEKIKAGTLAFIGTLDYDYASRYGVSATIRRDGSYRFADGKKWATFWSVAGRWNIDKEGFMEGSAFNMLKLRASYGTNGNQNIVPTSNNFNALYAGSNVVRDVYEGGTGYQNIPGFFVGLKNPLLTWERISQANVGVDFALFRNRIQGAVDYYEKTTSDLYLNVPISAVNATYVIKGNNGKMRNRGVEANLRVNAIKKTDFNLSVFANMAYNRNKILELPSEDLTNNNVFAKGGPAYQWNLYRYIGVNPDSGEALFLDKNGNQTEAPTADDRILTGKSALPIYTGGFGIDIDYKGFYLTSLFSYQKGGWAFDNLASWLNNPDYAGNGNNVTADMLNAWTVNNRNTDIPSLTSKNWSLSSYDSDRFLYKTDFVRLKNVSFGYNVKKELLASTPFRSVKVYVMGENLVTWTKWKGFDPEPLNTTSASIYPNPKTYSIGLNVEF